MASRNWLLDWKVGLELSTVYDFYGSNRVVKERRQLCQLGEM